MPCIVCRSSRWYLAPKRKWLRQLVLTVVGGVIATLLTAVILR